MSMNSLRWNGNSCWNCKNLRMVRRKRVNQRSYTAENWRSNARHYVRQCLPFIFFFQFTVSLKSGRWLGLAFWWEFFFGRLQILNDFYSKVYDLILILQRGIFRPSSTASYCIWLGVDLSVAYRLDLLRIFLELLPSYAHLISYGSFFFFTMSACLLLSSWVS